MEYTWSLKQSWQSKTLFSWSFKAFKDWKKIFFEEYYNTYGTSFKKDFPDKSERQRIYEFLLWVEWSKVFHDGDVRNYVIDSKVKNISERVRKIL